MTYAIVPSQREDFVELARSKSGRLYRKHILSTGPLRHPRTKKVLDISDETLSTLVRNFQDQVVDIVQVPLAGPRNEHTEDPTRNIGEVVGLEVEDGKLYSVIDARDEEHAAKLGKTLLGASAMIDMNYENARTGEKVGPALLHVCVTNRPYVTQLEDYQELLAASADSNHDAVLLTAVSQEETMTKDEMIAALRDEHGIDVVAMSAVVAEAEASMALSAELAAAFADADLLELSDGQAPSPQAVLEAVTSMADELVLLSNELAQTKAAAVVDELVASGRILPAQRDSYVELSVVNPELFEKMVPETPVVELSHEAGTSGSEEDRITREDAVQREIDAYTSPEGLAAQAGYIR